MHFIKKNIKLSLKLFYSMLAFFHWFMLGQQGERSGVVMSVTNSTHTFTLEWVQEVAAHFSVVSWRSRRIVHASHVVRRALEGRGVDV